MTSAAVLRESEKEVQRRVRKLLLSCDCAIYSTSQVRASMVSLGIPDLMVFSPLRGFAFIEVKAEDGRMSRYQREFQHLCGEAGITYLVGGVAVVRDWLGAKR